LHFASLPAWQEMKLNVPFVVANGLANFVAIVVAIVIAAVSRMPFGAV